MLLPSCNDLSSARCDIVTFLVSFSLRLTRVHHDAASDAICLLSPDAI